MREMILLTPFKNTTEGKQNYTEAEAPDQLIFQNELPIKEKGNFFIGQKNKTNFVIAAPKQVKNSHFIKKTEKKLTTRGKHTKQQLTFKDFINS